MITRTSTTLGYALLGLINETPRSGYDLLKVFASTPMGHFSSSPGAIYPALKRLQQQKLIEGKVDRMKSLRPKQVFRPTKEGTKVLRAWLEREITSDDAIWRFDELMLRFAFHSFLESRQATSEFLISLAREVDAYVRDLKTQRRNLPDGTALHGRLALESGIESYRAQARWARKALKHFSEKKT